MDFDAIAVMMYLSISGRKLLRNVKRYSQNFTLSMRDMRPIMPKKLSI